MSRESSGYGPYTSLRAFGHGTASALPRMSLRLCPYWVGTHPTALTNCKACLRGACLPGACHIRCFRPKSSARDRVQPVSFTERADASRVSQVTGNSFRDSRASHKLFLRQKLCCTSGLGDEGTGCPLSDHTQVYAWSLHRQKRSLRQRRLQMGCHTVHESPSCASPRQSSNSATCAKKKASPASLCDRAEQRG